MIPTLAVATLAALALDLTLPASAVTIKVLPPKKDDKSLAEAAVIIVPGAMIKGEAYRPLAEKLQDASPLRLWVALLDDWLLNTPNPPQLAEAVPAAMDTLQKKGMQSSKFFLAGHSLGGVFVSQYRFGGHNVSSLAGFLLWAAYPPHGRLSAFTPYPVLTLGGTLDGQTRITRVLDTFIELENNMTTCPDSKYRSPVISMPGVTHAQFASGEMPPEVRTHDLKPEVDAEIAYSMIANHTSAFLVATLMRWGLHNTTIVGNKTAAAALLDLDEAYNETKAIMKPLMDVKAMDVNTANSDQWVIEAQKFQAGLNDANINGTNQVLSQEDFMRKSPSLHRTGSGVEIATLAHLTYDLNPIDISTVASAPRVLSYKMASFAKVKASVPPGTYFDQTAWNMTCKGLNQAAISLALRLSSPDAQRRYLAQPRRFIHNDDVTHDSYLAWAASDFDLTEEDDGLHMTSSSFTEPLHGSWGPGWPGMRACKGLSPFRAMEWIYVDSLRPHKP